MVHADLNPIVEKNGFTPSHLWRNVTNGGVVTHDLQIRRCASDKRLVEPSQILAHESPGKKVRRQYCLALGANLVLISHAPISLVDCPFIQADGVGGIRIAVGSGVEGKLAAGIVQN